MMYALAKKPVAHDTDRADDESGFRTISMVRYIDLANLPRA
jgi:hypothetical protein